MVYTGFKGFQMFSLKKKKNSTFKTKSQLHFQTIKVWFRSCFISPTPVSTKWHSVRKPLSYLVLWQFAVHIMPTVPNFYCP